MFQAEKQEEQKRNGGGGSGMKRHQPAVLRLEPIRARAEGEARAQEAVSHNIAGIRASGGQTGAQHSFSLRAYCVPGTTSCSFMLGTHKTSSLFWKAFNTFYCEGIDVQIIYINAIIK